MAPPSTAGSSPAASRPPSQLVSAATSADSSPSGASGELHVRLPADLHAPWVNPDALRHLFITQDSQSIKTSMSRPFVISPFARDVWPPRYDPPQDTITSASSSSGVFKSHSAVNVTVYIDGQPGGIEVIKKTHPNVTLTSTPLPGTPTTGRSKQAQRHSSYFSYIPRKERLHPVIVQAKSVVSYVTLRIPSYPVTDTPLQIRARTLRGQCNVFLPPEFSGIVSWSLGVGQHGNALTTEGGSEVGMGGFKLSKALRSSGRVVDLTGRLSVGPSPGSTTNATADADVKKALKVHAPLLKKRPNRGLIKVYPVGTRLDPGVEPPALRGDLCELVTARGNMTLFEAEEFKEGENCVIN